MNKRDYERKRQKDKRKRRFEKNKRATARSFVPKEDKRRKRYIKGGDDWLPNNAQEDAPDDMQFRED